MVGTLYEVLLRIIFICLNIRHYILFRYMFLHKRKCILLGKMVGHAFRDIKAVRSSTIALYPKPGHSDYEQDKIVWEAPLAVSIWDDAGPLCGMSLEILPDIIHIRHLQGVAGVPLKEVIPDWAPRFVKACIRFARLTGITYVRLSNADNRVSYFMPEFSEPVPDRKAAVAQLRRRLRTIYDGTGRKLGLTPGESWSQWVNPKRAHTS